MHASHAFEVQSTLFILNLITGRQRPKFINLSEVEARYKLNENNKNNKNSHRRLQQQSQQQIAADMQRRYGDEHMTPQTVKEMLSELRAMEEGDNEDAVIAAA